MSGGGRGGHWWAYSGGLGWRQLVMVGGGQ